MGKLKEELIGIRSWRAGDCEDTQRVYVRYYRDEPLCSYLVDECSARDSRFGVGAWRCWNNCKRATK